MISGELTQSDKAQVRAYLWWSRIKQIRKLSIESLFVGLSLVAIYIGYVFAWGGVNIAPITTSLLGYDTRFVWGIVMLASGVLSFVGYVDARPTMEWIGMLGQFVFWLWTGLFLFHNLPYAYIPKIHLALGLLCAWVSTRMISLEIGKVFGNRAQSDNIDVVNVVVRS